MEFKHLFFISLLLLLLLLPISISQPTTPTPTPTTPTTPTPKAPTPPPPPIAPAPAPTPPVSDLCNGVFLSYHYKSGTRLPPNVSNPSNQPYKFQSTATILNNDLDDLQAWKLFVGFQHDELLVSASSAVLVDGSSFPAKVGNGTVFAGFPSTDLKTAIETAGDLTQMQVQIDLVGTQFGVKSPAVPMPTNLSLVNDGFVCPKPTMLGKNVMNVCCMRDPTFKVNITVEEYLPRQNGDLTILYDVLRSYDSQYWAQVTISNHNQLGRLDNWQLSWDWMRDEFIYSMRGAYPHEVDSTGCIFGRQGTYYKDMDFSNVLNCEKRPTIVDLPLTKANDSTLGLIPFCCRDGIILPPSMDPSKSTSAFQLQVQKMPPDLNRTQLIPPQNWKINGTLNPDYKCGPPIRVSPSLFPDSSGLETNKSAVASWQVVCNITQPKGASPRCCVSFSAYYNDSVIPCDTCACGCENQAKTCSATASALLLPPDALLVPFDNRTAKAIAWAGIKHREVPRILPCADNCGVSINWHLFTDFNKGWSARVTLFNWGEDNFADWFTAMQFSNAVPGFEKMYSFNGSVLEGSNNINNTIFMQGLPGLNYLVGQVDGANPEKDPQVPGKQQSVISFTKKKTPGINIVAGDGFPTKVFFNGEECSLPSILPTSNGHRIGSATSVWAFLLAGLVFMLIQQ